MSEDCPFCIYNNSTENCHGCFEGSNFRPKPITNADRIRAMSDEELAEWLGVYCNGQTAQEVGKPCISGFGSCEECWLDWLKEEEAEGDSNEGRNN